jgi:hypothetical protein
MLDNGRTPVTGRLWYLTPVVVTGKFIDIEDCKDDDELFHIVTDELQLGTVPAVIFDPRIKVPEIRFYRNGLLDSEVVEKIYISNIDVSLDRIFEVIDRIHATHLVTPDAQPKAGKLWVPSTNGWPVDNAEDIIQLYLLPGLATSFPTCTVRHEQPSVPGRLDIEIEECHPLDHNLITRHAVLELKVLRSVGSTGKPYTEEYNLSWVEMGVKQAATYRDERSSLASALCCFDMRHINTGEMCFVHVKEMATNLRVVLRLWYLYSSSKEYRNAKVAQTKDL